MLTQNKRLTFMLTSVMLLLCVPLIAMQFTSEVNWSFSDFLVASVLLVGTVLILEFILRKVRTLRMRIVLCVAALLAFALIWLELAVGVFGTPFAGN